MSYAARTEVSSEKTRAEIESLLARWKAGQFVSGWDNNRAVLGFTCRERFIRFVVPLPDRKDRRITHTDRGKLRTVLQQEAEYQQAVRATWRKLLLCVRAKLESVAAGIESFEEAFLAQIVLPGNTTVGEWAKRAIPEAYATGSIPAGLLALPPKSAERRGPAS